MKPSLILSWTHCFSFEYSSFVYLHRFRTRIRNTISSENESIPANTAKHSVSSIWTASFSLFTLNTSEERKWLQKSKNYFLIWKSSVTFVLCKNCAGRLYLEIGYHISLVNPLQDSIKEHEAITYWLSNPCVFNLKPERLGYADFLMLFYSIENHDMSS